MQQNFGHLGFQVESSEDLNIRLWQARKHNLVAKEEDKSKSFLKHPYILKSFIQLLEKCEENSFLLADWYYKTDKVIFANMIGNLIHGDKKEKVLAYLEKYDDIFEVDECVLIQSMCISYNLEEVQKYLENL